MPCSRRNDISIDDGFLIDINSSTLLSIHSTLGNGCYISTVDDAGRCQDFDTMADTGNPGPSQEQIEAALALEISNADAAADNACFFLASTASLSAFSLRMWPMTPRVLPVTGGMCAK